MGERPGEITPTPSPLLVSEGLYWLVMVPDCGFPRVSEGGERTECRSGLNVECRKQTVRHSVHFDIQSVWRTDCRIPNLFLYFFYLLEIWDHVYSFISL